jgi:hypothetical protein
MEFKSSQPDPSATDQVLADDRRTAIRYLCNLETTCQPIAGAAAQSWPARAVDISGNGIALVLDRRFERGAILSIRLESEDRDTTRNLLLRVVYAKAESEGAWRLGCAFASELGQEELRAFKAERVRPSEPDSRAWVRFRCDVDTVCRAVTPSQDETWPARVMEVSPAGMSLVAPHRFDRGTLLNVELPGIIGSPPRHVLVRVVTNRPAGANWVLGCELAAQISDQELQSFQ